MRRTSKSIGNQMAMMYVKQYSLSSNDLRKENETNINISRNNSLFQIKNEKKENIELYDMNNHIHNSDNKNNSARNSYKYFDIS